MRLKKSLALQSLVLADLRNRLATSSSLRPWPNTAALARKAVSLSSCTTVAAFANKSNAFVKSVAMSLLFDIDVQDGSKEGVIPALLKNRL
jgi:hypothetical protein